MTAMLYIDPGWMDAGMPEVSNTWRWFHLEQWMSSSLPAGKGVPRLPRVAAHLPGGYAIILRAAAWMVTEALWRDGCSRNALAPEGMRWARRLGLALVGDTLPEGGPSRVPSSLQREQLALERVSIVSSYFPEPDQAILRFALPPLSGGSSSTAVGIPSLKLELLVRLAKRHAAANVGVDLRQVHADGVASEPITPAAQVMPGALVESFRRDQTQEYVTDMPSFDLLLDPKGENVRHEPRLMEA